MEENTSKPGFDVIVRLVTAAASRREAEGQLANIRAAFEQFGAQISTVFSLKNIPEKIDARLYLSQFSRNRNVLLTIFFYGTNSASSQLR